MLFFDHDMVQHIEQLQASDWIDHDLVFQMDAIEMLKKLPDASIDLSIFDPAYESLEKHRSRGTTTRLKESNGSSNAWFQIFPDARYTALFTELYRVMKPGTHAYIFCDETTSDVLKPIAREQGFWIWKSLIWVKTVKGPERTWSLLTRELCKQMWPGLKTVDIDMLKRAIWSLRPSELMRQLTKTGMGYHWRASHERILFLEKRTQRQTWPAQNPTGTGRQLHDLGAPDVLYDAPVFGKEAYPTEKPIGLMLELIANSSEPGDVVLDMFAGSGVVGRAARQLDRRAILSDVSSTSIDTIRERFSVKEEKGGSR